MPVVDTAVSWICITCACIQIIFCWVYNHFRSIYYFYLAIYRGLHRQDVIRRHWETHIKLLADDMARQIADDINAEIEREMNTKTM